MNTEERLAGAEKRIEEMEDDLYSYARFNTRCWKLVSFIMTLNLLLQILVLVFHW